MSEGLNVAAVVDKLVDLDLVDLYATGPWPGEPEGLDIYEPDWTQIHPTQPAMSTMFDMPQGILENPRSVFDEVRKRASAGFLEPPPDLLDAQAWYTPMHYFGLGSAIYIRESAVLDLAVVIFSRLEPVDREVDENVLGACRAAMSVLYLHEAFHHKVESLAIRYEIVERKRRYLPYHARVVIPLLRQGSPDVLEEALACAEMVRRFKTEDLYKRGISPAVRRATAAMLPQWFEGLPPSYKQARDYFKDEPFSRAIKTLMCHVQEATVAPVRNPLEWDLAPHMQRGFFDCKRITHVLVPVGQQSILPWIGHAPALPSLSTRGAMRLLEDAGWSVAAKRGKGSHILFKKAGQRPIPVPANRKSLSPGVLDSIAGALGVRASDLRA